MPKMETATILHNVSPDQLQEMLNKAVAANTTKEIEYPKSRTDVMAYLGIRHVRTFNRRVQQMNIKPAGQIGKEPAFYLSQFFYKQTA